MDLPKFLSLLQKSALFFSSMDALRASDPFEGSLHLNFKSAVEMTDEQLINLEKQLRQSDPQHAEETIRSARVGRDFYRRVHEFTGMIDQIALNCWHIADVESVSMWKVYSELGKGIAIQSTIDRLVSCFSSYRDNVFISAIEYIDYDTGNVFDADGINMLSPALRKRKIFETERELRAVVTPAPAIEPQKRTTGDYVACDVSGLIESVHVAPGTAPWTLDLISDLVGRYGHSLVIQNSDFDRSPYF